MYTQLYIDWYTANGTEPSQDEFERFQADTMDGWLLSHGWLKTNEGPRYDYYWKGVVQCQVPHALALPVRFWRAKAVTA